MVVIEGHRQNCRLPIYLVATQSSPTESQSRTGKETKKVSLPRQLTWSRKSCRVLKLDRSTCTSKVAGIHLVLMLTNHTYQVPTSQWVLQGHSGFCREWAGCEGPGGVQKAARATSLLGPWRPLQ